jgi:transposase
MPASLDIDCEVLLRAIGADPATVVLPGDTCPADSCTTRSPGRLTDCEWAALSLYLPPEAPQSGVLPTRDFLDAVLWVTRLRKPWTALSELHGGEQVRRRFGRWAHRGIWHALLDATQYLDLGSVRHDEIVAVARRAARLVKSLPMSHQCPSVRAHRPD